MGDAGRWVLVAALLVGAGLVARIYASVFVPRRVNPRNGLYVREWWRINVGGSRGGGHDHHGGPF